MMIVAGSILGGATIAVFSLPWSYIHMLECIGLAFGASMVPVVSFNIGRKNLENTSTAFNYTLKTALMPTLVITGIIMLFAGPLISILTTDPFSCRISQNDDRRPSDNLIYSTDLSDS
ncbi:MAG: hypothetical protein IJT54_08220 [Candidatus Methanomethylophilaceae archaeon]|nr:hypothetical protein [Candidatus Methanomethylophilaceae archaeon]